MREKKGGEDTERSLIFKLFKQKIFMDPSYENEYRRRKLDPHKLIKKTSRKFENYNLKDQYSYEEILFILDQECSYQKCDRDVAKELFQQSATPENKASLNNIIFKYVENLQTSKLCLIREENSVQKIQQRLASLKGSKKSYVYLKMIQVSVHARFSSIPSLSYKIQPSTIPPVTIVNSLNPILNHEYTLQMETNTFKILFFESGVQIFEWEWPDSEESQKQGEYHRKVVGESLSFEVKLKYSPINSNFERQPLLEELQAKQNQRDIQYTAFSKLCHFQPFLEKVKKAQAPIHVDTDSNSRKFTNTIIQCMPFMADHVRNLYYLLILLLIFQCLASISWAMQFLDILLIFGVIAKLYEQEDQDLGMQLWIALMGFSLLAVKSIWGAVIHELQVPKFIVFLVMAIVLKLICILFIWFCAIRKEEILVQRKEVFYDGVDPKIRSYGGMMEQEEEEQTIWI